MVKRIEDQNDRCNKLIYLTKEGIGLEEQLHPWVAEVYEMATQQLDIIDIQLSLILLNKMLSNLKYE